VSKRVRGHEGVSLSLMTEACLGKPLDKSMQLSAWAARPLTERQLTYAGAAACCMRPALRALSPLRARVHVLTVHASG
jgi:ribonuclease D